MTLKEKLAERKRTANASALVEPQAPIADNQVAVVPIPNYVFVNIEPTSEFQALFEGCEDF